MSQKRKDTKGRLLREGEYQRPDGRYMYCCTDKNGNKITFDNCKYAGEVITSANISALAENYDASVAVFM